MWEWPGFKAPRSLLPQIEVRQALLANSFTMLAFQHIGLYTLTVISGAPPNPNSGEPAYLNNEA